VGHDGPPRDLRIDRAQGRHGRRDSVSRHGRDLPRAVSGLRTLSYVLSGALFLGAVLAIYNTLLIVRRDFVAPLRQLETGADAIASGEVDAVDAVGAKDASGIALAGSDQPDGSGAS